MAPAWLRSAGGGESSSASGSVCIERSHHVTRVTAALHRSGHQMKISLPLLKLLLGFEGTMAGSLVQDHGGARDGEGDYRNAIEGEYRERSHSRSPPSTCR